MVDKPIRPIHILFINEIGLMGIVIAAALKNGPDLCVLDIAITDRCLPEQGVIIFNGGSVT